MKSLVMALSIILIVTFSHVASAGGRSDTLYFSVKDAMESPSSHKLLDIPIYMKGQKHPAVKQKRGEFKSNKKTNAFRKGDQVACDIAFLSAAIALQQRAQREGGNAVIDVYSITRDVKYVDAKKYSCNAGGIIVHVALMGTVVTLK